MLLAIDVDYQGNTAYIAGIGFDKFNDQTEQSIYTSTLENIMPYQPGQFYQRELPCIIHLLEEHNLQAEIIVIDGFVWLDGISQPGLGAHLYQTLQKKVAIVGVAKNSFNRIGEDFQLYRGSSKHPLYITTAGMEQKAAIAAIKLMHGEYRLPTLLKKVDLLCRQLHKNQ